MKSLTYVCRWLFPALILCAFSARGAGVFTLSCDGQTTGPINFGGTSTSLFTLIGCGAGSVSGQPEFTQAGANFFLNGVALNIDESAETQGVAHVFTAEVDSFPTWTAPPPPLIPTVLTLTGTAQIPDTTGSFTVDLIGLLGGPNPAELTGSFNHTNCAQCTLNATSFRDQLRAPTAKETLTINTVGRVVYRTATPTFEGAIPEPNTGWLLGAGMILLLVMLRRSQTN